MAYGPPRATPDPRRLTACLKSGAPLPGDEGFVSWFPALFSGPSRAAGSEQAAFALNSEDAGKLHSVLEERFLKDE